MPTLETVNDLLQQAASRLDEAMKALAADSPAPLRSKLHRLGAAQVEIFEVQYQLWALNPALLPGILRGPGENPQAAFDVTMRRVKELVGEGAVQTAIGVLDLFIAYQRSPHHLELARQERAYLVNGQNA
jgi:hypothetical protein